MRAIMRLGETKIGRNPIDKRRNRMAEGFANTMLLLAAASYELAQGGAERAVFPAFDGVSVQARLVRDTFPWKA